VCFVRQNSVIRLKSNILSPPNFWAGYATVTEQESKCYQSGM